MDIIELIGGSCYVRSDQAAVRVGSVPDAPKLTRAHNLPPADIVVLHTDPWLRGGAALCGVEFDFWGKLFSPKGYFATGEKLFFVCRPEQVDRLWTLLRHAFEGPSDDELAEFGIAETEPWRGWQERLRLRDKDGSPLLLSKAVEVVPLTDSVRIGNVTIEEVEENRVRISDGQQESIVDARVEHSYSFPFALPIPEQNPTGARLAVHTLGCYPGTDPNGGTTCYRVVANGLEYVIDGMPGLTDVMIRLGVGLNKVQGFLLSHTHQDHLWTAVEQMLQGSRVRLIAAPPVYAGFICLAAAITGRQKQEIKGLVDWTSIEPEAPVCEFGVRISADWVTGPVPTTAFRIEVDGSAVVFSSDAISRSQMQERGMGEEEIERVIGFCLSGDYGIVDCGGVDGDPVHGRPKDWLEDAQRLNRKIVGTHTSKTYPGLEMMAPGKVKVVLPGPTFDAASATALGEFTQHARLSAVWHRAICSAGREKSLDVGDTVDERGFVVSTGSIGIYEDGERIDILQQGDPFFHTGATSATKLTAEAASTLIVFPPSFAEALLGGGDTTLEKYENLRSLLYRSQQVLISPEIAEFLAGNMEAITFRRAERIIQQGAEGDYFYILKSGTVGVSYKHPDKDTMVFGPFGPGFVFGTQALMDDTRRNANVDGITNGELYRGGKQTMTELLRLSPGLFFSQLRGSKVHARLRAEESDGDTALHSRLDDPKSIVQILQPYLVGR